MPGAGEPLISASGEYAARLHTTLIRQSKGLWSVNSERVLGDSRAVACQGRCRTGVGGTVHLGVGCPGDAGGLSRGSGSSPGTDSRWVGAWRLRPEVLAGSLLFTHANPASEPDLLSRRRRNGAVPDQPGGGVGRARARGAGAGRRAAPTTIRRVDFQNASDTAGSRSSEWEGRDSERMRSGAGRWILAAFCCGRLVRVLTAPRVDCVVALTSPPLVAALAAVRCRLERRTVGVLGDGHESGRGAGSGVAAAGGRWPGCWSGFRDLPCMRRMRWWFWIATCASACWPRAWRRSGCGWCRRGHWTVMPFSTRKAGRHSGSGMGSQGKYVVMYSGNHSPVHPLDTLLEAASG